MWFKHFNLIIDKYGMFAVSLLLTTNLVVLGAFYISNILIWVIHNSCI